MNRTGPVKQPGGAGKVETESLVRMLQQAVVDWQTKQGHRKEEVQQEKADTIQGPYICMLSFPGGLVVRIRRSHRRRLGLIPGQGRFF